MMHKDNQVTFIGCIVWVICALFFLYEFLLRTVIGTFQSPIMYDLGLSTFRFSLISSTLYLVIYGAMQIPVGLLVDKYGLKKSLLVGAITCTISVIGFANAHSYATAVFFRILAGFGSSFGFICLIFAVYDWLPNRYSALFIGLSQFIGTIGPIFAAGPLATIALHSGISWRIVFLNLGFFGIILTTLVLFFVKNNETKVSHYLVLKRPNKLKSNLLSLFTRKEPWAIALFSALVYFSLEYLSENEGKIFMVMKGYSASFASYMISLAWIGYAIGCPLLGFLSDFFQRRRVILIGGAISCTVAIAGVVFSTNQYVIIFAFCLLGFSASSQSIGFAIMAEQFKKNFLAIGLSLNNAMITLFGSINAPMMGWLIDKVSNEKTIALEDYYFSFSFLVFMVSLSIIFAVFLIKETYCKSVVDLTITRKALLPTESQHS